MKKAIFSAFIILFLGAGCFGADDGGIANGNGNDNANANGNMNLNANTNTNANANANANANGNLNGNGNANANRNVNGNVNGNSNANVNAAIRFSNQEYYRFSYLISGPGLSDAAREATAGFSITNKANADGTVTYTVNPRAEGYQDRIYTLRPGEKLYFIDRNLTDDDANANVDDDMSDDSLVVVDAAGNVVSGPTGW